MKKSLILGVLLFVCALLPLTVNAADSGAVFFASKDASYSATTLDSAGFTINSDTTSVVLGIKVSSGTVTKGTKLTINVDFSNSNYTFGTVTKASGWTAAGAITTTPSTDGKSLKMVLTVPSDITTTSGTNKDGMITFATVAIKAGSGAKSTDTCSIGISQIHDACTTTTSNGKTVYYCTSGTTTCDATTYNSTCTTPENPKTGSVLPYAVIGIGVVIAGVLFIISKKNKMYQI